MRDEDAPSICAKHVRPAYGRTYGRTNEQETGACVTNESSLTDTRAHVQNFNDVETDR